MRCRLLWGLALVLLTTLPTAPLARAAAPDPTVQQRTPPAEAWRIQRFEPTEYFTAAELRRWAGYRQSQRRVGLLGFLLELSLYLLLVFTTLSVRIRDRCLRWCGGLGRRWPFRSGALGRVGGAFERILGPRWHGSLLFAAVVYGLLNLIVLPLSLWQELLAQQAGLSNYSAVAWGLDAVKSLLLGGVLFGCVAVGLYGLMRRFPRRWWLLLAGPAALGLVAYGYIEPQLPRVYHKVRTLDENNPRERVAAQRLKALAKRSGVTLTKIKVIRTSRTSRALGAYVVGLGDQRELVIYDSLLERATTAELEAAVAHELGHEQHRSDLRTYGLASVALVALLGLIAVVLRRGGRFMGASGAGDMLTLPLLALVVWLVFTSAGPIIGYRSRVQEREADRHGLVLTGDPDAFIRLHVRLVRRNQADVRPPAWVSFWLGTHPSPYERIGTARWYRSWLRGRGQKSRPPARSR